MTSHAELDTAVNQTQGTLDRKRQHLERAVRYLDECPDGDPRKADAERRVSRLIAEKNVAEVAAHAAADALIEYEDAHPTPDPGMDASEGFGYWPGEDAPPRRRQRKAR